MKLTAVFAVLCLAASASALRCYTCKNKRDMPGYQRPVNPDSDPLFKFPYCEDFDPYFEDQNRGFIEDCPPQRNKTCFKLTDQNDYTNVLRMCHSVGKPVTTYTSSYRDCTDQGACYCETDLCNGAGRGWPSVVLLLVAALFGGR